METKRFVAEMWLIQADLPYRGMLAVPSVRHCGGLALLWMEEIELHVQTFTLNHIDALIMNDTNNPWRLTGFYGWPDEMMKHKSWQLLKHLHTRHSIPWLCCGDFNEILNSNEKQGRLPKPIALMQQFRATLLQCRLVDLGFQGNIYTWNNGRDGVDFVQERLDRACATVEWRDMFPQAQVRHIHAPYSDHNPILIITQPHRLVNAKKKIPRRFEEKWATHPYCEMIIQTSWEADVLPGSPMARLFEKIKRCRFALLDWSRATFGHS